MRSVEHSFWASVPRETRQKLENYTELVSRYQSTLNLTSGRDELWNRHIADSAQLFSLLSSPDIVLADVGSGGGFPGIVLSILGVREVHLIERDRRKAAFLREAARIASTKVVVHAESAENIRLKCDVITARAVANLPRLLELAYPFTQSHSICLFPKGENYSMECEMAREEWQFDMEIIPSQTGSGAILKLFHVKRLLGGV